MPPPTSILSPRSNILLPRSSSDSSVNTDVIIGVVVAGIIILAALTFACWKGEKVGRKFHMPFRDSRRKRKARAVQAANIDWYAQNNDFDRGGGPGATELAGYPVSEMPADGGERARTPPPAYLPREAPKYEPQEEQRRVG